METDILKTENGTAPEPSGFMLYVHVPFCEQKCNYCDFLSAPAGKETKKEYVRKLIEEIRAQGQFYRDRHVSSIFIGGGTPSCLEPVWIENIISTAYENFAVLSDAEITIECNPGTLTPEKLEVYRVAGVNRISMGLQSSDNNLLKILGRIHTYEDFLQSYEYVRNAGFDNVNIDLMSGIPSQTLSSYLNTLRSVLMLKPEHISAYSLIIEEGTPFYEMQQSREWRKSLPDEDTDREMYHQTAELLARQGLKRYEISNYAKEGFECRHNIGYWTGVEYLGLGLGASSYVMNRRFHVERDLRKYMQIDFARDLTPLYQDEDHLSMNALMGEFMILGLRMTAGVSGSEFRKRFHRNMYDVYQYPIDKNLKNGLLEMDAPHLRLTEKGLDLANVVMRDFI